MVPLLKEIREFASKLNFKTARTMSLAGAFGAKLAAQAFDVIARTEVTNGQTVVAPPHEDRDRDSPDLEQLRTAAEEGLVQESSDSDLEAEAEVEAEAEAEAAAAAAVAAEEEREERARLDREEQARLAAEALASEQAEERARRAREKEEREERRKEERSAHEAARRKAYEDWVEGDEPVTFEDGSVYEGKWRARRQDSDWENGGPRVICRHGHGTYRFPDGSTYEGDWKHDLMHGQGIGVCGRVE
jgi:hypothetical protein